MYIIPRVWEWPPAAARWRPNWLLAGCVSFSPPQSCITSVTSCSCRCSRRAMTVVAWSSGVMSSSCHARRDGCWCVMPLQGCCHRDDCHRHFTTHHCWCDWTLSRIVSCTSVAISLIANTTVLDNCRQMGRLYHQATKAVQLQHRSLSGLRLSSVWQTESLAGHL